MVPLDIVIKRLWLKDIDPRHILCYSSIIELLLQALGQRTKHLSLLFNSFLLNFSPHSPRQEGATGSVDTRRISAVECEIMF
jgi:hypothetical protein